jgi:hypothetical protein
MKPDILRMELEAISAFDYFTQITKDRNGQALIDWIKPHQDDPKSTKLLDLYSHLFAISTEDPTSFQWMMSVIAMQPEFEGVMVGYFVKTWQALSKS